MNILIEEILKQAPQGLCGNALLEELHKQGVAVAYYEMTAALEKMPAKYLDGVWMLASV